MATTNLNDLYVEKLKDLYSAEQQILKALPKMEKAAGHADLQNAFETHRQQTETHVQRLEQCFEELGVSPRGKMCHGMQGIIEEGAELIKEKPEPGPLDAGLIAAAQCVEHYEMASYGSVCAWAQQLGYDEQAELLKQTLDEERETDQLLTKLAEQSVNVDAEVSMAEEDDEPADMPRRKTPKGRSSGARRADRPSSR